MGEGDRGGRGIIVSGWLIEKKAVVWEEGVEGKGDWWVL